MPKMDEITKQVFSIEEKKVSTLIVAFIFFSGLGGYQVIKEGDIPPNLVNVLLGLITAIGAVNAVDKWVNRGKANEEQGGDTNETG